MNDILDLINQAAQTQNWILLVAALVVLVAVLVSVVLKALGKGVPLLDTIIEVAKGLLKFVPKKAPPPPATGEAEGIAKVVPVEDAAKPEPMDTLK